MTRQKRCRLRKLDRGECARCPAPREWPKTLCLACLATPERAEQGLQESNEQGAALRGPVRLNVL
jgi:hypothetical protein